MHKFKFNLMKTVKLPLTILSLLIIYFFFLSEFLAINPVAKLLDKTTMNNVDIVMPLFILFVGLIPFFVLIKISRHLVSKNIISYWFLFVFLFVAPLYLWVAWLDNSFHNSQNVSDFNSKRVEEKLDAFYEGNKRLQSQVRSLEEQVSMLSAPINSIRLNYDRSKFSVSRLTRTIEVEGTSYQLPQLFINLNSADSGIGGGPEVFIYITDFSKFKNGIADPYIYVSEDDGEKGLSEFRNIKIDGIDYKFTKHSRLEEASGSDGDRCDFYNKYLLSNNATYILEKKLFIEIHTSAEEYYCNEKLTTKVSLPDARTLEEMLRIIETMELPY